MKKGKDSKHTISDTDKLKELLKHEGFEIALRKLILKIYEIDTVRNINEKNTPTEVAVEQLANKKAVDTIEEWLNDIFSLSIYEAEDMSHLSRESETEDIIKRFKSTDH